MRLPFQRVSRVCLQLTVEWIVFLNQMIINANSYATSVKQKNYNRDYLKKKKSQEAFYIKAKINSQLGEQLKYIQSRKSQARVSTSMIEINPKEDARRVGSLEMHNQISVSDNIVPPKQSVNKHKKNVGHCWSQRNINIINESSKIQKYRKFSSNADLDEEQGRPESQRRKLSLVDEPAPSRKVEKLGLMAWLVLIRKLFVEQFKKRSSKTVKLNILYSYIHKLDNEGLDDFSLVVEPLEYEVDLTKSQIVTILESHFACGKKPKPMKTEGLNRASFCDVMSCLIQFQSKSSNVQKQNPKSTSPQEQAVETARFQEGGEDLKKRKLSEKKNQLNSLVPKMQTHKYIKENGKQNAVASVNTGGQHLFKSPSACSKSKQSLNPSQSPFTATDPKSIQNSRVLLEKEQSGPLNFKRGGFEGDGEHQGLLGMLTIQGKSPRQLMVSQIYESIQKQGFVQQNNVSFSLQHIQIDNHFSFEQTVHSFQQILKKIQNIQINYKNRLDQQLDEGRDKSEEEVNMFLEQLINYRIASSNEPFEEESYSYLVSFENLGEFKEHNKGIMMALLHSTYLKEYFHALQGIKIKKSLQLLKNLPHLLHPAIRIMNISYNNISSLSFILDVLPHENSLQFLNINNNYCSDITPILKKCTKLRQLHCHSNLIAEVKEHKYSCQELKIIDLSSNKLEEERNLRGLITIPSLVIINILSNPLSVHDSWKSEWSGSISINSIYMMDNLYVMSSYGHQKDITFSIESTHPKNERDRYKTIDLIHQFSISDINRPNEIKLKQTPKTDNPLNTSKSSAKDQPKQKISKIKAFIDGKII